MPEGKVRYRVWYIANPPREATFTPVDSPEEGAKVIRKLIAQQLRDPRVVSNVFGLEVSEDTEWHEWYNDEGDDVLKAFNLP